MASDQMDAPSGRPGRRNWPTYVAIVLLLLLTAVATVLAQRGVTDRQAERFDAQADRLDTAIQDRVTAYSQVLRGGVGLFESSDRVTRLEWIQYVEGLRLDDLYPGFKSLSFAPATDADRLPALRRQVRREQLPSPYDAAPLREYELRPPTGTPVDVPPPPVHAPILYVAPWVEDNQRVLGVDMMLEPSRRDAMMRAAETGSPVTSPRLRLSGSSNNESGFIVYMPIEQDGRLLGWLTAAFLAESFIQGVDVARGTDLEFEVGDGSADGLLYSSAGVLDDGAPSQLDESGAPFAESRSMPVPGSSWTVRYVAPEDFVPTSARSIPYAVALLGLLITLLFVVLAHGATRWRRVADVLDEQATGLREAREVAERATEAKSRFLATMSHEIRTPLTSMIAAGDLLDDTELDTHQTRFTGIVRASGTHLVTVLDNLLDLSRIEAGKLQIESEPFDVRACMDAVALIASPAAEAASLTLLSTTSTDDADDSTWVVGDEGRLRQIVLNLVTNAIKFTPAGGTVRVSAHSDGQRLRVEVADTGVGIAPEQIERLFEAFEQAEAATARSHGGAGLGLAICSGLVEVMGGRLSVASEPGVGSTFRFSITAPRSPAHVGPRAQDREPVTGVEPATSSLQVRRSTN